MKHRVFGYLYTALVVAPDGGRFSIPEAQLFDESS
jgi:hypothetical protein